MCSVRMYLLRPFPTPDCAGGNENLGWLEHGANDYTKDICNEEKGNSSRILSPDWMLM
jgi:hypothetical protein